MQFSVLGTVQTGIDALDYAIGDLEILQDGDSVTVFASSGPNGGLASYSLSGVGTASLIDYALFNPAWSQGISTDLALIDDGWGGARAVFGATNANSLGAFSVALDGTIGTSLQITGLATYTGRPDALAITTDGELLVSGTGTGFSSYESTATTVTSSGIVVDDATALVDSVSAFAAVDVLGNRFVIAGSDTENGITVYQQTAGGLIFADVSGPDQGVGMMVPTAMAATEVAGTDYVVVATAMDANGALSVFQVSAGGALTATDHVIDTLDTRFGGVQSVEVIEHAGMSFVVAGGGDDGLSLFLLLPGGQLQLLDTIADTFTTGLSNVSAIAGAVVDGRLRLLVGSQSEGRLTDLAVDLAGLGVQSLASATGETIVGTAANDVLVGQAGDDRLDGGAGDDILVDGAGSDTMSGGLGRDTFVLRDDGASDAITDFDPIYDRLDLASWPMFHDPDSLDIVSTAGGAVVTWRRETLYLFSKTGSPLDPERVRDSVVLGINRPMDLSGVVFPDAQTFDATSTNDLTVFGGAGAEVITTGSGADTVYGGNGDDVIHTGLGDDYADGGSGADTIWLDGGDDRYVETDAESAGEPDEVHGGDGADRIDTGGGDDFAYGDTGNDHIGGGMGNDSLFGGDGHDTLTGGIGEDRLDGEGDDDALNGGDHRDLLFGGTGSDALFGGAGDDELSGDADDDWLFGNAGDDTLDGGSGDDVLTGGGGADRLFGHAGDDRLSAGGELGTELDGGDGNDLLVGGQGADLVLGGDGNDTVRGGSGNDSVDAGNGRDSLEGDSGSDVLQGWDGDDRLFGGSQDDVLYGGRGNDLLFGGTGNDRIYGADDNDVLVGLGGRDVLFGEAGDDWLFGDAQDDQLDGGDGNDNLIGGDGNDWLAGGVGEDTFRFFPQSGHDTVADFDPSEDRFFLADVSLAELDLSAISDGLQVDWGSGSVVLLGLDPQDFDATMIFLG